MRMRLAGVALATLLSTASAIAAVPLTDGTGDGKVSLTTLNAGAFGSAVTGATNAVYDPIGATLPAGTTFESYVYLGVGGTGGRTNISNLAASLTSSSATGSTSTFSSAGLNFTLTQTLADLLVSGAQTGSVLTQSYAFTNSTADTLSLEFVRYIDGDLTFNNTDISDGGGRFINGLGQEFLFETDTAIGSADSDTFLGIYNEGGTSTGYEVAGYSGLRGRIGGGTALAGTIQGDSNDADQFIDAGNGYDVTLGLGRAFSLAAGATGTFTTYTVFGTGTPSQVVIPPPPPPPPPASDVPEPASWAMMVLGFGATGCAVRRRRVRFAAA